MRQNQQTGISFQVQREKSRTPGILLRRNLPALALCAIGLGQIASRVFPSTVHNGWAAAGVLFTIAIVLSVLRTTRFSAWYFPVGILLLGVAAGIWYTPLRDGVCVLCNDVLAVLPEKTGKIFLLLKTESDTHGVFAALFAAVLSQLLLCGSRISALLVIVPCAVGAAFDVVPGQWGTGVFLAGCLLRVAGGDEGEQCSFAAVSCAVCVALAGIAGAALNSSEPAALNGAENAWHAVRYDSASNSMPEGQLNNLGGWEKNDTPALEISMEKPQKLYLRGMTGESYTGTSWKSLSGDRTAGWADTFYWLHKDGYNALTSVSAVSSLTGEAAVQNMTVRNLSACRKYAYLPYALCAWDGLDEARIGDAWAPGCNLEEIRYISGSVPDWFTAQSALAVRQRGSSEQSFLQSEKRYRQYVTENYLQISEEVSAVISRTLELPTEDRTLSQIKDIILTSLENRITYRDDAAVYNDGSDFLTYVLEQSGSGYSVHYATVAVLMLRYFGVPARYVEGYFLSTDDAAHYTAGETIVLTEENAHAWAEYYLDGVGWIPFETTPGYIDEEELNAGPGSGLTSQRFYHQTEQEREEEELPEEVTENSGMTRNFREPLICVAIVVLLAAVAALIMWVVLQRRRLFKALRRIEQEENRGAIAALYGYASELLCRAKLCPGDVAGAEEAAGLNREALFSTHDMTDAQRSRMRDYVSAVLQKCLSRWNLPQRLFYRWVQCLYL